MKSQNIKLIFAIVIGCFVLTGIVAAQTTPKAAAAGTPPKSFATPDEAANALIDAADKFDVAAIEQIFGSAGKDLILTSEPAQDKDAAKTFVELAREKKEISVDPKNKNRAVLNIGKDDWPFAVPLVKKGGQWSFDPVAGRQEIMYRRIGDNELDAIDI